MIRIRRKRQYSSNNSDPSSSGLGSSSSEEERGGDDDKKRKRKDSTDSGRSSSSIESLKSSSRAAPNNEIPDPDEEDLSDCDVSLETLECLDNINRRQSAEQDSREHGTSTVEEAAHAQGQKGSSSTSRQASHTQLQVGKSRDTRRGTKRKAKRVRALSPASMPPPQPLQESIERDYRDGRDEVDDTSRVHVQEGDEPQAAENSPQNQNLHSAMASGEEELPETTDTGGRRRRQRRPHFGQRNFFHGFAFEASARTI